MESFSPYAALQENASRQPDAEAIVIGRTTISYCALLERVTACASWLLRHDLRPDEVTGIAIRNEVDHIVCAMALLCLNMPQISLGSHEKDETKRALARKVCVTQLVAEHAADWMSGLRTVAVPCAGQGFLLDAPATAERDIFNAHRLDSIAVYQNTSGSTNIPKTFGMSLSRLLVIADRYAKDPKERRALRTGSIEFDAHRINRLCSLLAGNTCVFLEHLDAHELVALCERTNVSIIHMGAYRLGSFVNAATRARRLPSTTGIISGGSRVPGSLRGKVKALLTQNLWVQYATSEAGLISIASPDQHDAFPEGVGLPISEVTAEIVGSDDEVLAPGEIGQLRVCKTIMARSYIDEPAASSKFKDGWFYTGDLLSREDGEPLVFHGRADDMMILNGINIFPSAIEDTLESHADVREAVAFAVKSRIHGEIPIAAVVLSPDARTRGTAHLLNFCRKMLGVRAPREIRVVDAIPRNSAGKRVRRELARS
jgi:long-chain acyl-CoA synthetase